MLLTVKFLEPKMDKNFKNRNDSSESNSAGKKLTSIYSIFKLIMTGVITVFLGAAFGAGIGFLIGLLVDTDATVIGLCAGAIFGSIGSSVMAVIAVISADKPYQILSGAIVGSVFGASGAACAVCPSGAIITPMVAFCAVIFAYAVIEES
jgi:hypothetical protein